jgi:hypothetical protein
MVCFRVVHQPFATRFPAIYAGNPPNPGTSKQPLSGCRGDGIIRGLGKVAGQAVIAVEFEGGAIALHPPALQLLGQFDTLREGG